MALIKKVRGVMPKFGVGSWLAENATIIGQVSTGKNCTVWFNAVVRGDVNSIEIGDNVNIQDGVVIHCTYQKAKTIIGDNVSIGHNALVHGCTIEDNGIGREASGKINASKKIKRKSMGMSITTERIEVINKLYNTENKVEVIDLYNDKDEASGTKVIINIPI